MKQQNTKQQFIDLYTTESEVLFRYCFFKLSDKEQALDITQESFVRLWNLFVDESSEEIKNPRALVFKIASNLIIDWYKKKKSSSLDALIEQSEDGVSTFVFSDDSHEQIQIQAEGKLALKHLSNLDSTYQQVVYLRYVEDLPPKEISEIVDLPVNVVSVRINRGIQELKKIYGEQ